MPTGTARIIVVLSIVGLVGAAAGCTNDDPDSVDRFRFSTSDDADTSTPPDDVDPDDTEVDTSEPEGAPTGAACVDDEACEGGRCLTGSDHPDGYCTRRGCTAGTCAGEDAVCITFDDDTRACRDSCLSNDDCRDGYECLGVGRRDSLVCAPQKAPESPPFSVTKQALDVRCNPTQVGTRDGDPVYQFDFQLGPNARSFAMVPYVTSGVLRPIELVTPNETVDLQQDYKHHNGRVVRLAREGPKSSVGTYGRVAFDWPIVVPYAPKFSSYAVAGGSYTLELQASGTKPCLYVLEKRSGRTLDLNFYFVGADGLSAEDAKTDRDFQEAVSWMKRMFQKVGIRVGNVRYKEVADEIEQRFEVVDSRNEAFELMAYGRPPGRSLADHLSVDVFLVNDLQFDRDGRQTNVLGLSAGVPGAAGMHGNIRDGLIFQVMDLGFANRFVGLIMAHEIGHFLGLRHTTEVLHDTQRGEQFDQLIGTTDPLDDTEVCSDIRDKVRDDASRCPDYQNLMFPLSPPRDGSLDAEVTRGQGAAMRANPLVTGR